MNEKKEIGQVWISENGLFCRVTKAEGEGKNCCNQCDVFIDPDLKIPGETFWTNFSKDWLVKQITREETPEYFL